MRYLTGFLILFIVSGCNNNIREIPDLNSSLITGTYHSIDSMPSSLLLGSYNLVPEEYNRSLIQLDSNGCFKIQIKIDYPQALTIMGKRLIGPLTTSQSLGFFIFPGDTLNINFSDSIKVKANNLQHQNFIQNYIALIDDIQQSRNEFPFHESVQADSPEEFKLKQVRFNNHLRANIQAFIKRKDIQDQGFKEMVNLEAKYIIACNLIDYKFLNEYIYRKKIIIPKDFFSQIDSLVNTNNDNYITYEYFNLLNRLQILYSVEQIDTLLKLLNYESISLTQDILLGRGLVSVLNKDSIATANRYFESYKNKIKNAYIKKSIEEEYNKRLSFDKNPKARNAFLTDLSIKTDNNSVLKQIIKDHKGKIIYVKFWGPWCGPCMEELPFDKMLINEINPDEFAFVNLCVKTKKEDWEYTISNKKISGSHYFLNDDQYNKLAELFNISGIPFHIIIGKDGKVIENNAPSPGSTILNGLDQGFLDRIKTLCRQD